MKISREINGQTYEFELTEGELLRAYWEEQKNCDRSDCEMFLESNEYTVDDIDDMVEKYRETLNDSDARAECEWYAMEYAFEETQNK